MRIILLLFWLLLIGGCSKKDEISTDRTYRMGFQNSAPRFDNINLFVQSLDLWTQRADAAIISIEVPWGDLLGGMTAQKYIADHFVDLVKYYRSKKLNLWVYVDPANGLNRATDAGALVKINKSIANSDIQLVYQKFVLAMDSMLMPEHVGLALETNFIKASSPTQIYDGVKKIANETASKLKARGSKAKLSVSIQADHAWGLFTDKKYKGIDQDIIDFQFVEELGISSYPYFFFDKPQDIPADYYSKLMAGKSLPTFISEGGWTSQGFVSFNNAIINASTSKQADYMIRQSELLKSVNATAWFQLVFTDIDTSAIPTGVDPTIQYFVSLGLVDINLKPKESLTQWDTIFKRPLK